MKQDEIKIGEEYLFVNNGHSEDKKDMHNKVFIVLNRIKGKCNHNAFHVSKRAKKPDKFLLDNGRYANASNLKEIINQTNC